MGSGIDFSWTEADLYGQWTSVGLRQTCMGSGLASVGLRQTCMGQWY